MKEQDVRSMLVMLDTEPTIAEHDLIKASIIGAFRRMQDNLRIIANITLHPIDADRRDRIHQLAEDALK